MFQGSGQVLEREQGEQISTRRIESRTMCVSVCVATLGRLKRDENHTTQEMEGWGGQSARMRAIVKEEKINWWIDDVGEWMSG